MALPLHTKAPDFTLPSTDGSDFTLSKDLEGSPLILFFYPQDFTPACTREACSFRDNFEEFQGVNIPVLGISTDSMESHLKFRKSHNLPFHLLSDEKGRVSKLYKAKMPVLNKSKRITYLIDKDHRIASVHSELFGAEKHIQRMLSEISSQE